MVGKDMFVVWMGLRCLDRREEVVVFVEEVGEEVGSLMGWEGRGLRVVEGWGGC